MVRPRSVTTSADPQLSAYSPHFLTSFFWVLTVFFFFRVKKPGQNLVQFSPTPSMANPLWRSPKYGCRKVRVYPAECSEQLGRDLEKNGSSKFLVLKSFSGEGKLWDSSLPVTLSTL